MLPYAGMYPFLHTQINNNIKLDLSDIALWEDKT